MSNIDYLVSQTNFNPHIAEGIDRYFQDIDSLSLHQDIGYIIPKLLYHAFGGPDARQLY